MDRVLAILKYWERTPPVNELVAQLFDMHPSASDEDPLSLFPDGNIR